MENFKHIKKYYGVPAEINREVVVNGKKGVIVEDMGNYIGVVFYDSHLRPVPCHPTWEVAYLDSFNHNPPKENLTRSQKNYREFLNADWFAGSFSEWIKAYKKYPFVKNH